jgi:hypothetical protein
MDYNKAIWAIAHRLCRLIWKVLREGVRYVEDGLALTPLMLKCPAAGNGFLRNFATSAIR